MLREAAALRGQGRWLLLPALLMWPLHLLVFGSCEGQCVIGVLSLGPFGLALLLGGIGCAIEFALAPGRPQPRRWRGRWWALLAFAIWAALARSRLDARLWLWVYESDLVQVVAKATAESMPVRQGLIDGFRVSVVGPARAVVIHMGTTGLYAHGIAHDPTGSLPAGGAQEFEPTGVQTLWGPWRLWTKND